MKLSANWRVRLLFVALGAVLSVAQTILAWNRGAAPSEVFAPALYIVVFAGAIFGGLSGGLIAAVLASGLYALLLSDLAATLGGGLFTGLLFSRVATYFFYAVVVALGSRYLEQRLTKLAIYDQIDDLTGLYNAPFVLQHLDLEASRSRRYQTLFSVVVISFSGVTPALKISRQLVVKLARLAEPACRDMDRVARLNDGLRDQLVFILPETGHEGAEVFARRTRAEFARQLPSGIGVVAQAITYPDELEELASFRTGVQAQVDREALVK